LKIKVKSPYTCQIIFIFLVFVTHTNKSYVVGQNILPKTEKQLIY